MSMRTIARSSSNRKSASALASSVLPTPVGPRNRNEPVGRSGSAMPARERRTASDDGARPRPAGRSAARRCTSSMRSSLAVSPSSSRPVGMPVQASTTSAISSGPTSSRTIGSVTDCSASRGLLELLLELGDPAVEDLAGAGRGRPRAGSRSACMRSSSICLRSSPTPSSAAFSRAHRASSPRSSSSRSARSARSRSSRSRDAASASRSSASSSIFIRSTARRSWSISTGETRSPCAAGRPTRRRGRSPCRAAAGR